MTRGWIFAAIASAFVSTLLVTEIARADDKSASGTLRRCVSNPWYRDIPGFARAQVSHRPAPRYPDYALRAWGEGWVLLEYGIAADGEVRDIAVVDAIGHKDFVRETVRAASNWRYKPATRNGQAVEQFLDQTSVLYLFEGPRADGARGAFVRKYDQARNQISDNQFNQAIATLEEAFKARLNHYEQAMGSFLLGLAYTKKGDWPRALFHIRHAVIEDANYLEPVPKKAALALLVELEARNGNLEKALCAFEDLRKVDPQAARPGGPAASNVARIETALAAPGPIAIDAQLAQHPLIDAPAVWRHRLLRAKFSFDQIKGEVKSFRLACLGTTHEAPVEADVRWDVPPQAGLCILRVDGAPGATFRLIEEW